MTETVSTAPPHVDQPPAPTRAPALVTTAEAGGSTTGTPRTPSSGRTAAGRRSPAATCAGRSSPSSSASWSGSSGASSPWRCPPPASSSAPARSSGSSRSRASWVPRSASPTRSWCRSSAAATGRSSRPAAAHPDDRAGRVRLEPRDPVRRAARRGGARGLRRRQLRQLDVEHHVLLPAAGEGLGAGPQRRRRQPRRLGRPVRRADRHHDRRWRGPEPAARRAGSGSRSSCSPCSAPGGTWTTSRTRRPTSRARRPR